VSNKFRVSLRFATVFSLVVVVLFFLAACGNSNDSTATKNNTTYQNESPEQVAPYQAPEPTKEDVFYGYINSEFPGIDRGSALQLGNVICQALGQGTGLLEIGQIGVNAGFTPTQAGKIVGASIGSLCPEYKYLVDQLQ